jgi:hypothetical protein
MEVRRDPRSCVLFIILLLLINSPEPQGQTYNVRERFDELIEREYGHLRVLNSTRYGDLDAKKDQWLNVTGLRNDDSFAWELLEPVKAKAKEQSERLLGDGWKGALDGTLEDDTYKIPVYRNLSGYVQGEWVRSPVSRVRHPSDMGNSSAVPESPFPQLAHYDRNLTGHSGSIRLHITELEGRMRTDDNKTISEISAKVVIGDDDSFGGNWWEFMAHGVHFTKSGTAVLTTTSDRYAGIFGLPHFQINRHLFSSSQTFLNRTIYETIERQRNRVFPLWNPWTSSTEGNNDGMFQGHHCEFVLYLQEAPTPYGEMEWLENEMRYPTGARLPQPLVIQMNMVAFSPDCGFVIESKGPPDFPPSEAYHLMGTKTETFNHRARQSIIAFSICLAFQLYFVINQMKETATPSMRSRVSFYTVALMAVGDGFTFLILIFMYLFLGTSQLALYSIAFLALFSVLTHLRFLMDIWSVHAAERARQIRQSATTAAPPVTSAPTPAPPPPEPGSLPLPITAARPPRPPTPIIIASDQDDLDEDTAPVLPITNTAATPPVTNTDPRVELGALYSRFCLLLIILFFTTVQFATARTIYRTFYFRLLSFLYLSFWTPQIHRNVMRNCRKALRWDYVLGMSVVRIAPIAYFYLKEDNVMFAKTDEVGFMVLAGWVWCQVVMLASQEVLGSRWCVKSSWGWVPEAFDYHPILREDAEEGGMMPLNVSTSSSENAESSAKSPGESRMAGKDKKVFDCSICAMDIEVPVLPAGGDEGGMNLTGMILQRRLYMVTPCRHVFHTGCLEGWMRYRLMCPNCREVLPPL